MNIIFRSWNWNFSLQILTFKCEKYFKCCSGILSDILKKKKFYILLTFKSLPISKAGIHRDYMVILVRKKPSFCLCQYDIFCWIVDYSKHTYGGSIPLLSLSFKAVLKK